MNVTLLNLAEVKNLVNNGLKQQPDLSYLDLNQGSLKWLP